MKTALIPPVPALQVFGHGDFHLLLSHLMEPGQAYHEHYYWQRRRGAYLVVDNSAHENGAGDDPEMLMFKAQSVLAQEVVVPDVLEDAQGTVEGAIQAHETWFEKRPSPTDLVRQMGFMYVPQGASYSDWQDCLRELVSIHLYTARKYTLKSSFVIGLSKDYEVWDGGLMRLLDDDLVPLRQSLLRQDVRMHCHLLGWGRNLWNLYDIARRHTWIRSTDSAKPFVYALSGVNLMRKLNDVAPEYPKRPPAYFSTPIRNHATYLSRQNVMVFQALAEGRDVL